MCSMIILNKVHQQGTIIIVLYDTIQYGATCNDNSSDMSRLTPHAEPLATLDSICYA